MDSPYEEYVNEWNKDIPTEGDDAIDQDVYEPDTGVFKATEVNEAFEVKEAGHVEFEPTLGDSNLTTLPSQPNTPRGVTTPTQDDGSRPTRIRKPVSRLVPSFKGKSYGTTMAQIGAQMVNMTTTESIRRMERELSSMGIDDGDAAAIGIIMMNMSIKQCIKKLGVGKTTEASVAEIKQIHMRDCFKPKHYHKLTREQKAKMVESFIFLKEKKDGTLKARAVLGGNVQQD